MLIMAKIIVKDKRTKKANEMKAKTVKKLKFKKHKRLKTFYNTKKTDGENDSGVTNWQLYLETQRNSASKQPLVVKRRKKIKQHGRSRQSVSQNEDKKKNQVVKIWFDDVDPSLLNQKEIKPKPEGTENSVNLTENKLSQNWTKYIALDCEMVGVGINGNESVLARASLVNLYGECIYDSYVRTIEKVVDYRTKYSGVRAENLKNAQDFKQVQKDVAKIIDGRVLVGHALKNDLSVLMLSHPRKQIRDTAKYKPFKKLLKTKRPALKKLAAEVLKINIQEGEHSSVIDARTTMLIFQRYKKEWEKSLRLKVPLKNNQPKTVFIGNEDVTRQKKKNKWTRRKLQKNNSKDV